MSKETIPNRQEVLARMHSCTGKEQHFGPKEAVRAALHWNRKYGKVTEFGIIEKHPYKCKFCPFWHIGGDSRIERVIEEKQAAPVRPQPGVLKGKQKQAALKQRRKKMQEKIAQETVENWLTLTGQSIDNEHRKALVEEIKSALTRYHNAAQKEFLETRKGPVV